MREILFRGRRIDNGQWAEGAFLNDRDGAFYICPAVSDITYGDNGNRRRIGCWFKVDPTTVGQYTGMIDNDGKRIFEGDVVYSIYSKRNYVVLFDEYTYTGAGFGEESAHGWYGVEFGGYKTPMGSAENWAVIVGNIHDNPELLEEIDNASD